jgi:hypothetical protein
LPEVQKTNHHQPEEEILMPQFTVPFELHEAQWPDYDTLHAAMKQHGFSRLITSDDGRTYQLPWAEHDGAGNFTSMQVLEIAQSAAATTGKRNSVLLMEAKSRAWSGLPLGRN